MNHVLSRKYASQPASQPASHRKNHSKSLLRETIRNTVFALITLHTPLIFAVDYPVAVTETKNDNTLPVGCSNVNKSGGGPAEVALDLDADGTGDICIGSSSTTCGGTTNFDCGGVTGGSLCSTQSGTSFMGGTPTATALLGQTVGPGFAASVGSIFVAPGPSFFVGFKGGSKPASSNLVGYFEMAIDATTCAYTFGRAYFESSAGAGITFVSSPLGGGGAISAPIIRLKGDKPIIFSQEVELK